MSERSAAQPVHYAIVIAVIAAIYFGLNFYGWNWRRTHVEGGWIYYELNPATGVTTTFSDLNVIPSKDIPGYDGNFSYSHNDSSGKVVEKYIYDFTWQKREDTYYLTEKAYLIHLKGVEKSSPVNNLPLGTIKLADNGNTAIVDIPEIGRKIPMHRHSHDWSH